MRKPVTLFLVLALLIGASTVHAYDFDFSSMTKEQKLVTANSAGVLFITAWGVALWDYGKRTPRFGQERWFQKDTKEGGADKMGHFCSNYILSRGFSYLCESWGYDREDAALYGALSSWGLMAFTEFGDSFSDYGFSYEDFVMDSLGSCAGYLLYKYPQLSSKIDFRVEYNPDFKHSDIFTDYERMKFLLAVKLDGFESVKSEYLKYLELQLGYYARGYSETDTPRSRNVYVGIGINISKILSDLSWNKTAAVFNYYQPPFTYVSAQTNLD